MIYYYKPDAKRKYKFNVSVKEDKLQTDVMQKFFAGINELNARVKVLEREDKQLVKLKQDLKKHKKDTASYKDCVRAINDRRNMDEIRFVRNKIKEYRDELKHYAYQVFILEIVLGTNKVYHVHEKFPTKENIKTQILEFVNKLSDKRKSIKQIRPTQHDMNGIIYSTIGGVFTEKNTVLKLQGNLNNQERIRRSKKPHPKIKEHYIGVELELIAKVSRDKLDQEFIKAKLAGNVYIKDDGSIRTEEDNDKPHEVTILCQQSEYPSIIKRVCAVLNDPVMANAYVNNSCGMHVHFDIRNRDAKLVYGNLVRMLPLLKDMVPAVRTESPHGRQYCALNISDDFDNRDTGGRSPRYQAVNPESAMLHKTIEVRLHSGTINAAKIINWIKICLYAVESLKQITVVKNERDMEQQFSITSKLKSYIRKRIDTFNSSESKRKGNDTRVDHFLQDDLEVA